MCGLTGYLTKHYNININHPEVIEQMLLLQAHRGPDDRGIKHLGLGVGFPHDANVNSMNAEGANLHFGFNRLSILDLSANGHQPMTDESGKVVLMMNGEIYNAFNYKSDLQNKGYRFKSNTDTEVVLNLYLAYGFEEMIRKLNGMFGIVLYDAGLQRLFIARDRFGIKPLYILNNEHYFAFSSEMKSFKALPNFKFELDINGMDEYLLFRNRINQTLFKGIVNITPGTYLELNEYHQVSEKCFYNINEITGTNESCIADIDAWLNEAVITQLMSDVKLGCQLSGGVDSSLVTYYAHQQLKSGQLETISIVFNEPNYSEKKYIDEVVSQLNLLSHQYVLDASLFLDSFEKATWHFEQPLNHPNTIGIYELSKQAAKHVTVLLSGEGADEIFGGYTRFWLSQQWTPQLKYLAKNKSFLISLLPLLTSESGRVVLAGSFGDIASASAVYKEFSLSKAIEKRLVIYEQLNGDSFQKHRKFELLSFLPDLLMRQDKMSMAWHIENRVPFLDNHLVENALRIDKAQLLKTINNQVEGKYLLKALCAEKFSQTFAFRSKMGFTIPLKNFFSSNDFRQQWHEQVLPSIKKRGLFNDEKVAASIGQIQQLNQAQLDAIWQMFAFETWAQQYQV